MDDIKLARLRKTESNKDVTPIEVLELALADIREGRFQNPTKCMVYIVDEPLDKSKPINTETYRCGVTRIEEVGVATFQLYGALRRARLAAGD